MGRDVSPKPAGRRLHLVFLVRSFGFPHGWAATNRLRLLGLAMAAENVDVSVLVTRVSERPGEVRNRAVRGSSDGIGFLYTPGSTTRSDSFVRRRLSEARGYAGAIFELARRHRSGRLDCVYLAALPETWRPSVWLLLRWLRRRGVPVVVELNEIPGETAWMPRRLARHFSHLDSASGVVAISSWLVGWSAAEAARIGRRVHVVEIPIVVDVDEGAARPYPQGSPSFLYSASSDYGFAVAFILRAMRVVWERYPDCEFVVTGMRPQIVADLVRREGVAGSADRVRAVGYVERERLVELYAGSSALLIPLFDNLRSRARFPTKIGEYLAAGRPVVTTAVGEVERFFHDRESAYISAPEDPAAFARSLIEIVEDPGHAEQVGAAGRELAETRFEYLSHGPALRALLDALCDAAPAPSRRRPQAGDVRQQ